MEKSSVAATADIVVAVAWDKDPLDVAAVVADALNQTELKEADEPKQTKLEEAVGATVAVAVIVAAVVVAVVVVGKRGTA